MEQDGDTTHATGGDDWAEIRTVASPSAASGVLAAVGFEADGAPGADGTTRRFRSGTALAWVVPSGPGVLVRLAGAGAVGDQVLAVLRQVDTTASLTRSAAFDAAGEAGGTTINVLPSPPGPPPGSTVPSNPDPFAGSIPPPPGAGKPLPPPPAAAPPAGSGWSTPDPVRPHEQPTLVPLVVGGLLAVAIGGFCFWLAQATPTHVPTWVARLLLPVPAAAQSKTPFSVAFGIVAVAGLLTVVAAVLRSKVAVATAVVAIGAGAFALVSGTIKFQDGFSGLVRFHLWRLWSPWSHSGGLALGAMGLVLAVVLLATGSASLVRDRSGRASSMVAVVAVVVVGGVLAAMSGSNTDGGTGLFTASGGSSSSYDAGSSSYSSSSGVSGSSGYDGTSSGGSGSSGFAGSSGASSSSGSSSSDDGLTGSGSGTSGSSGSSSSEVTQRRSSTMDSSASCGTLGSSFDPVATYETDHFLVTICGSGSAFGYHGQDRRNSDTISLPATQADGGYRAVNGSTTYLVDGSTLRVYQGGVLQLVEAVRSEGGEQASTAVDVLGRLAGLLQTAHDGRVLVGQLADGVNATAKGCPMSGQQALKLVGQVISNRDQVESAGRELSNEDGADAVPVAAFVDAMDLSGQADEQWQQWIEDRMVPFTDGGCRGNLVFSPDPAWEAYLRLATQADGPKTTLVDQFDPLAAARNLKSDWTIDDL